MPGTGNRYAAAARYGAFPSGPIDTPIGIFGLSQRLEASVVSAWNVGVELDIAALEDGVLRGYDERPEVSLTLLGISLANRWRLVSSGSFEIWSTGSVGLTHTESFVESTDSGLNHTVDVQSQFAAGADAIYWHSPAWGLLAHVGWSARRFKTVQWGTGVLDDSLHHDLDLQLGIVLR